MTFSAVGMICAEVTEEFFCAFCTVNSKANKKLNLEESYDYFLLLLDNLRISINEDLYLIPTIQTSIIKGNILLGKPINLFSEDKSITRMKTDIFNILFSIGLFKQEHHKIIKLKNFYMKG